ncbi:piercer of microtubule wall 1 protein-like [Heptranchias perlo]|uniref:piercer of microtubule wall 1 protein-like n=1 Tax=Heptranchias perlo TaxID=212740 RepID=UPI003559C47E
MALCRVKEPRVRLPEPGPTPTPARGPTPTPARPRDPIPCPTPTPARDPTPTPAPIPCPDLDLTSPPAPARTSQYYRVHPGVPERFEHPDCFKGYRSLKINPIYRTTNQTYGSDSPTVHEMPTSYHAISQKLSNHLSKCGMYRNHGLNVGTEKSLVTGPGNLVTFQDRLNFHHSYFDAGPSYTD